MSVTGTLAAFALWHTFRRAGGTGDDSGTSTTPPEWLPGQLDSVVNWARDRFTDHSQALPKALGRANDRAWEAVGLALAGDGFFASLTGWFRDRDMTAVRDQIRQFIATTPTGLDATPAPDRKAACGELTRLRNNSRLSQPIDRGALAADIRRLSAPGDLVQSAREAVATVADSLASDAPALAQVLRLAPPGGPPLLVTAFLFFLRREVETNDELAHGLTFDSLRHLTAAQDRGFALLDGRTEGILDQIGLVFDELAALRKEMQQWQEANRVVNVAADAPLGVSVSNEPELARLRAFRDRMRKLPAEIVEAADWQSLGDDLDAGGLFPDAWAAHQAAAAKAKADANRSAEAENEFRAYKDACETGKWAEAKESLARAIKLDPRRFQPFDRSRFRLDAVLGVGGFGTVFRCFDTEDVDDDGNPIVVAIKSLRGENLDRDPRVVFAEARTLRDLHRVGTRIIRVINWGYAYADPDDPDRKERPYIVMEYFPGETLEAIVSRSGPLTVPDFLAVARQIVEAVREAHTRNVYHRDLKPSNVMARRLADGSWDVRVIDFGLAVRYESAYRASMNQASGRATEKDRSLTGSLDFAPPEQRGKLPGVRVGPHSDVYAFGKTSQWLLFRTTEPLQPAHWKRIPETYRDALRALIEAATAPDLTLNAIFGEDTPLRLPDFGPVLTALDTIDPIKRADRERAEAERKKQAEAAERARAADQSDNPPVAMVDKSTKRSTVFGYPPTAIFRWMGYNGWSIAECLASLPALGLTAVGRDGIRLDGLASLPAAGLTGKISETTIRIQWAAGKKGGDCGGRGPVPDLTTDQIAELNAAKGSNLRQSPPELSPLDPARPRSAGDKVTFSLPGDVKMVFAWCPPGTFLMGSKNGDDDEQPVHLVTLTQGIYTSIHPVTQAQWKAITGVAPSRFQGDSRPVESVCWGDCQAFCEKLTTYLDRRVTVRLPSEAEWEYACRAGTTTEYHTGDGEAALKNAGWYLGNSGSETHPVGKLAANAWGLCDMHGNVWEWCQDWYGGPYAAEDQVDPTQLTQSCDESSDGYRVLRGGAWCYESTFCRAAFRFRIEPESRYDNLGCRVVFGLG